MSLVFSQIFGEDLKSYLPFITLGMIFWTYLSGSINDSSNALISADSILKQMPLDPSVFVIRNITKHTVVLAHNLIVIPVLFIFLGTNLSIAMLVFPIAIGLVILNLYWINLLVAITSARFRDFGPIVTSLMAVIFFVTPVLWRPNLLPPGTAHLLLGLNPLYHFLQLLRLPLSGDLPTLENWIVSGVLAAFGIVSSSVMAKRAKKSIASWL